LSALKIGVIQKRDRFRPESLLHCLKGTKIAQKIQLILSGATISHYIKMRYK